MTITTTPPISLTDVMNELRVTNPSRAYPISLGDSDVRALAGVPSGPISLTNLYGKSTYTPMTVYGNSDSAYAYSGAGAGTVSCHPSVTVVGGNPAKSYLWEFMSNPNGCTLSDIYSPTCTVSKSYAFNAFGSATATLRCFVGDGTTTAYKENISASLEWSA